MSWPVVVELSDGTVCDVLGHADCARASEYWIKDEEEIPAEALACERHLADGVLVVGQA